jgi:hypothetical protein
MKTNQGASRRLKDLVKVAACVIGLAAVTAYGSASAQSATPTSESVEAFVAAMHPADLEHVFWVCDYKATIGGVHATPVVLCSAVWDELKQTKFAGSFEDLLAWWQSNKAMEHEALATSMVAYRVQD